MLVGLPEYLDGFAARWAERNRVPGLAVAVTDRKKVLGVSTVGMADLAAGTPVCADTLFEIGSLGKPFTSIALLQLRDEGQLDLHAPVAQYLPWFQILSDYSPITVHHLMNHTAGLVRGTDIAPHGLYESWALSKTRASAAPGEYFSYSNVGYKTLGFLLEELTGSKFPDIIKQRVLDPLGMTRSHPAITVETRARAATGYCGYYDDRPEHLSHPLAPAVWAEYATGDGCEASTIEDMAIYLRMLLNRGMGSEVRLLSEESFDLMTLNCVWTGGDYYGYGLATYPVGDRTYIGHGGGNAGFRSAIVVDLVASLGVVFLLNRMGETDPVVEAAQEVLTEVRDWLESGEFQAQPAAHKPDNVPDAAEYSGIYRSVGQTLELNAERGKLLLQHQEGPVALERRGPNSFYVNHPDWDLFLLDFQRIDGQVVEVFHGPRWFSREGCLEFREFNYPKEWESYTGHYRARNPELSNFRIVLRKDCLFLIIPWGEAVPLVPLGEAAFRIGEDARSPETLRFDALVGGEALLAEYSGCPYYRTFTS